MSDYYVPGTEEKDPSKIIMSLQQAHEKTAANETDIAALQAAIAGPPWGTGTVTSVATSGLATGGPITSSGTVTVTAAAQTDQETASSTTLAVTPGRQQYHPSAAKAWAALNQGAPNHLNAGYNVSSVTDLGTGDSRCNLATAFTSTLYAVAGLGIQVATATEIWLGPYSVATSNFRVVNMNTSGVFVDTGGNASAFGDQ